MCVHLKALERQKFESVTNDFSSHFTEGPRTDNTAPSEAEAAPVPPGGRSHTQSQDLHGCCRPQATGCKRGAQRQTLSKPSSVCPGQYVFQSTFNLRVFPIKIQISSQAAAPSFDGEYILQFAPIPPPPPYEGHASGGTDPHSHCFSSSLSMSLIYNRVCKLRRNL